MGFVFFFHCVICILLVTVILMQSGRGGGLTESFSSAENLLGAQTSTFMSKLTTVFCVIFFITSIGLAVLSTKQGKSLMVNQGAKPSQNDPAKVIDDIFNNAETIELNMPTSSEETPMPMEEVDSGVPVQAVDDAAEVPAP